MRNSIRAFSDERYDYYELTIDLGGIVPKGAIFVHDTDDTENGSIAEGCLKLCWTPDGNVYSDMFKKVRSKKASLADKVIDILEKCINDIKACSEK